ncbi:enoyl-CoA hydratase/isomerase family protein [Pararhodobacter aggregans]
MNRQNAPLAAPGLVQRRDYEGVAVLRLNGPDGNRMSPALVGDLAASLEAVLGDPAVEGVVLTGGAPGFCAGAFADLPLPGPDPQTLPPVMAALANLCDRIEGAAKPVVAALSGRVASGGLALALAAEARIAAPGTVFLSPEARLGRLPPGGAAVRLAWQIGAGPALTLIAGRAMGTQNALAAGLVEAVADDPVAAAIDRVLDLGAAPRSRTRPGLDDPAGFAGALAEARAALPTPCPRTACPTSGCSTRWKRRSFCRPNRPWPSTGPGPRTPPCAPRRGCWPMSPSPHAAPRNPNRARSRVPSAWRWTRRPPPGWCRSSCGRG